MIFIPVNDIKKSLKEEKVINLETKEINLEKREFYCLNGYRLNDQSLKELLRLADVHFSLFKRLPERLKLEVIKELLPDEELTFVISEEDKEILHLFKKSFYLTSKKLVEFLEAKGAYAMNISKLDGVTYYDCFIKEQNENLIAGISFEVSIRNYVRYYSGPFFFRVICSNGFIGAERRVSSIKAETEEDLLDELSTDINYMFSESEKLIKEFLETQNISVIDPTQLIYRFEKHFRLPKKVLSNLLDTIPSLEEKPTLFNIINFVSSAANNFESIKHQRALREFSCFMIETKEHICPKCYSPLSE